MQKIIKVKDYYISEYEYQSVARNLLNHSKEQIEEMIVRNIDSFNLIDPAIARMKQRQYGD